MNNQQKLFIAKAASAEESGLAHEQMTDYEGRRQKLVKTVLSIIGGLYGSALGGAGAASTRGGMSGGTGAVVGGLAGAGAGYGIGAGSNKLRNYLGFSAMGAPVTDAAKSASLEKEAILGGVVKGIKNVASAGGMAAGRHAIQHADNPLTKAFFGSKAISKFSDAADAAGSLTGRKHRLIQMAANNPNGVASTRLQNNASGLLDAAPGMMRRPAMIAGGVAGGAGLYGAGHGMGQRSAVNKMQNSYENMNYMQRLMMALQMMGGQGPKQIMDRYA